MKDDPNAIRVGCDLCGRSFQFGPHRYDGRWISHYQMSLCSICMSSNEDGIGPLREPIFEAHLKRNGIPLPSKNKKGWYPLQQ